MQSIDSKPNRDEIDELKHQLKMRDQLVQQLSGQLFQMVQEHPPALPAARSSLRQDSINIAQASTPGSDSVSREDLKALEEQISFYQNQIDQRDTAIGKLKQSCQELSDRNQMLENVIQELPEVYRQQFALRLEQFKEKLNTLKAENHRLMGELNQKNPQQSSEKGSRKLFLPYNRAK